MSLRRDATRGVAWLTVMSVCSQGLHLLTLLVLARLLVPREMGLVAYASFFTNLLILMAGFGLGPAVVQRRDLEPAHLDAAFWMVVVLGIMGAGLAQGIAFAIGLGLNKPDVIPIIQVLGLGVVFGALAAVPSAVLVRAMRFRALAARTLASAVVGSAVGISMALKGFGVWSLVAQHLCAQFTGLILLWLASHWYPRFRFSLPHLRHLAGFGANILMTRLTTQVSTRSIDFLIGTFIGDAALGYFHVGSQFVRLLRHILLRAIQGIALPVFARLQDDLPRARTSIRLASQAASVVAMPAFIGVAVLAPPIIRLSVGEKWVEIAVPIVRMLAMLGIVNTVAVVNTSVLEGMGRPSWALLIRVVNAVVGVAAFFIALPWGLFAVTGAFVARAYLVMPLQFYLLRRLTRLRIGNYLRQFVAPLSACLVMAVVVHYVNRGALRLLPWQAALVVAIVTGVCTYAIIIYRLSPFVRNQCAGLRAHLRKRLRA